MTRNSGTPAERPLLALAAEPCSDPELRGAEQAEQGAELVPVPLAERAAGAALNAARELWLHPDRFLHSFAHPEPETMKEHWAHVQSRAWVPEELTGTPEKVVAVAGVLHHLFVAYPLKAAAKAAKFAAEKVDEVADRPLRLYGLLVFLAVLFVLLFVL